MGAFTPQAACNIQDLRPQDLLGHMYRLTEKIDGIKRFFFKAPDGSVSAFSKTFKQDQYVDHICKFFEQSRFPINTWFDTELVDFDGYFRQMPAFELRTLTNSIAQEENYQNKQRLMAIVHDYYQRDSMENLSKRTTKLFEWFSWFNLKSNAIMIPIIGNLPGEELPLAHVISESIIRRGGEGLMMQDTDMPYIQGKSKHLIRIKRKEDFIGTIVAIEMAYPGTKIEGLARTVICDVDGCTQNVAVGSGFNNEERKLIADYREEMLGTQIEIEAFGRSKNVDGETSLSMPTFKRFCDVEEIARTIWNKDGFIGN